MITSSLLSKLTYPTRRDCPRLWRAAWLLAAALLVWAGGSVALAQSSYGFDLACRTSLNAGGGLRTFPAHNVAIFGALGQPIAGRSQAASIGVRGGYIQPFTSQMQAVAAAESSITPVTPNSDANTFNLPLLVRFVRVVRGGC